MKTWVRAGMWWVGGGSLGPAGRSLRPWAETGALFVGRISFVVVPPEQP